MWGRWKVSRCCKLTPEVQERIVAAVRDGAHRGIAATLGGIAESTLYAWLKDGSEAKSGLKKEFLEAIKKAEAEWEQEQVKAIREVAEGGELLSRTTTEKKNGDTITQETYTRPEWTARAWLLERKAYERWSKKERVEITGDKARPLSVKIITGDEGA